MTKRDGAALWRALREQKIEDDLGEIEAMTDAELDAYITANGGDPKAIREAGAEAAREGIARRERLAWHGDMEKKLDAFRATAEASRSKVKLPRTEILARLEVARKNPRFAAPVAMLFQKKTFEASTDEELQALLDQIELLAKLEDEGEG